jgi:ech hydrogenase subunit B
MNSTILTVIFVILAPVIGGLIYGIERKVRARMQRRIGPPILQPFYDFFKLAQKRTFIVHSTHAFLGIMHFVSLWFALAVMVFGGDFILVIYLHLLSTALLIIAGYSTRSVFSHLGSNRLAISALAYEPVLILIAISMYMVTGSYNISSIAKWLDYIFAYVLVYLFVSTNIFLAATVLILTFLVVNALDNSTARVDYKQMLKFTFWTALPAALINLLWVTL